MKLHCPTVSLLHVLEMHVVGSSQVLQHQNTQVFKGSTYHLTCLVFFPMCCAVTRNPSNLFGVVFAVTMFRFFFLFFNYSSCFCLCRWSRWVSCRLLWSLCCSITDRPHRSWRSFLTNWEKGQHQTIFGKWHAFCMLRLRPLAHDRMIQPYLLSIWLHPMNTKLQNMFSFLFFC